VVATSPFPEPQHANPHLRWHPLRGEWVTYAAFRQNRTYQPPPQYNPLAPTQRPGAPDRDAGRRLRDRRVRQPLSIAGAGLARSAHPDGADRAGQRQVRSGGVHPGSAGFAGRLPLSRIELLLQVWGDRTTRIGGQHHIQYVLPFENRGAEVGVTLHHPHGQIYAYPFVPPVPARQLAQEREYYLQHGASLLCDMARDEAADGKRVLYQRRACDRLRAGLRALSLRGLGDADRALQGFAALTPPQRASLARALKTVLLKFDNLWDRPFPYLMAWYQAPTDGAEHPETQLHAQFYPPYRTRDRLKYLAGTELAAGMFAMDVLPETTAYELQQVEVALEDAA
jgi:UDPglucose--hexose-1-phosphate uridylyltransferase